MTENARLRWRRPERNSLLSEGVVSLSQAAEDLFVDYGHDRCTDCAGPINRTATNLCHACDRERYVQEQRARRINDF